MKKTRTLSAGLLFLAAGCAGGTPGGSPPAPASARPAAKSLVLLIADGGGMGAWSLARFEREGDLAVASMPVVGLVDTRNAAGGITDSAAGATAYATGVRTLNGAIAVDAACRQAWGRDSLAVKANPAGCGSLPTLLERAERMGKATGLVTTTVVSDATPASFAAHAPDRYMHTDIAPQMLASGVDVLMGGGRAFFDGSAIGGADLLAEACARADCPGDARALARLPRTDRRLIGLFAPGEMPRAGARAPDLPTMTRAALDRLARDPDGFFLLVETEGTDSGQHANEPIDGVRAEITEFDRAVEVVLAFAAANPQTLVVVTADHETGGAALHRRDGDWALAYTGPGHTGAMVPLFAAGPGAERLAGIHASDEVGRILRDLLLSAD